VVSAVNFSIFISGVVNFLIETTPRLLYNTQFLRSDNMFNKSIALGLVAAGLMIAPTTALANQSQSSEQITEQNSSAINGSTSAQTSTSVNVQKQILNSHGALSKYRNRFCPGVSQYQSQNSSQLTAQSGAAIDGSVNAQDSTTTNTQSQALARAGFCR
jgi:hypothetical protein